MLLSDLLEYKLPLRGKQLGRLRGSYGAFIVTMTPEDFLHLTTDADILHTIEGHPFPYDMDKYTDRMGDDKDFGRYELPYLDVRFPSGQIIGHEGRHRALMVLRQGGKTFPVAIYPKQEYLYSARVSFWDGEERKNLALGEFPTRGDAETAAKEFRQSIDPDDYIKTIVDQIGGGSHRGAPARSNSQEWTYAKWEKEDFPAELVGQFADVHVPSSRFRIGLVKGYTHHRA